MSLIGLGSVSDYLIHHSTCATLVVRPDAMHARPQHPFTVCVALDESERSAAALKWTLDTGLVRAAERGDQLHCVSTGAALEVPDLRIRNNSNNY